MRIIKTSIRKRKRSPREINFSKWYTLHNPFNKWYRDECHRIISRMNTQERDEFCAKFFPKTTRDKEIEEWREKQKQKELEQMSPEEKEVLDNFWEWIEKEESILKKRKAIKVL